MCDRSALNPKFAFFFVFVLVLVFILVFVFVFYLCFYLCFVIFFPLFLFVLVFVPVFVPVFARSQVAAGGSKCVRGNWGVCSEFCLKFVFGPKQQSVPCIRHIIMECNFLCCFCQSVNDVNGIPLFDLNDCLTIIGPIISFL